MIRAFVRAHRVVVFYLTALAIVTAVMVTAVALGATSVPADLQAFLAAERSYPNAISIVRFAFIEPAAWLILVFAAAPTLAAMAVTVTAHGPGGLAHLAAHLKPWRTPADRAAGRRAWLILLSAGVLGTGLYVVVALALGSASARAGVVETLGPAPLAIVAALAVGPFIDEGGLLEELGWRGFALPLLVDGPAGPLRAALTVGLMWWAWHLPREVTTLLGGMPWDSFLGNQALFLLLCLAMSVVIMPFWLRTGGSALTAIFIHGITNVWSKALGAPMYELTGTDVRTWIVVGAAGLVLAAWGPALGRPSEPRPP